MVFKRVLHPVGHGAFFTEQFLKDRGENSYLNVVYDCGSTGMGGKLPKVVRNEVSISFNKKDHIDLFFISHFDEDHTNGLNFLLDNTLMDKDTYAVVPFAYPYLIMVMEDRFPSLARFIRRAIDKGLRFLGLRGSNLELVNEYSEDEVPDGKKLIFNNGHLFKVVDIVSKKVIWYFYPFMKDNVKCFQKDFENAIDEWKKAKHFTDDNLNDAKWVLDNISDLKTIYQSIGHRENGVTEINVNSLLMLSFPAYNVDSYCFWLLVSASSWFLKCREIMPDGTIRYIFPYGKIDPSCLYTGDTVMADINCFRTIVDNARKTMRKLSGNDTIGLMQIPHHGSKKCFPASMVSELAPNNVEATFLNCDPYSKKTPRNPCLIPELTLAQIPLFIISDSYHSRLEVSARV